MNNPLFNMLGGNSQLPGMFGNIQQLTTKLNEFKQNFSGDPKQKVQQLLNSGQMSQNQYNQLSQLATQIQNMLNKK